MKNEKIKNFFKSLKSNRAVYITAVTLLVALTVIISITVAANRSKKNKPDKQTENTTVSTPADTTAPSVTTRPPVDTTSPAVTTPLPTDTTAAPTGVQDPLILTLPVGGVLTSYHDEVAQVWSNTMRDYRVHLGIDIATEANAPVYAAADGVISQIYEDVRMGYCISIKHSDDTYTVYSNLGKDPADGIEAGVNVKAGQLIGCVGNSAMVEIAEDPHLHLEMTVGGKHINPLDYFDQTTIASLNIDTKYEG